MCGCCPGAGRGRSTSSAGTWTGCCAGWRPTRTAGSPTSSPRPRSPRRGPGSRTTPRTQAATRTSSTWSRRSRCASATPTSRPPGRPASTSATTSTCRPGARPPRNRRSAAPPSSAPSRSPPTCRPGSSTWCSARTTTSSSRCSGWPSRSCRSLAPRWPTDGPGSSRRATSGGQADDRRSGRPAHPRRRPRRDRRHAVLTHADGAGLRPAATKAPAPDRVPPAGLLRDRTLPGHRRPRPDRVELGRHRPALGAGPDLPALRRARRGRLRRVEPPGQGPALQGRRDGRAVPAHLDHARLGPGRAAGPADRHLPVHRGAARRGARPEPRRGPHPRPPGRHARQRAGRRVPAHGRRHGPGRPHGDRQRRADCQPRRDRRTPGPHHAAPLHRRRRGGRPARGLPARVLRPLRPGPAALRRLRRRGETRRPSRGPALRGGERGQKLRQLPQLGRPGPPGRPGRRRRGAGPPMNTITAEELMAITASRLLNDHKVVFAGVGMPLLASALARHRHAPHLTIVLEGGIIGATLLPGKLPISTNEMRAAYGAQMLTDITDIFLYAQRGYFDYGFLGAAQVDMYGNINTSVIGTMERPKVRLPGSGGANDIISLCHEVLIVTQHEPRRFVARVDFITSPGYLSGGDSRARAGLLTGRLGAVVTDLALLDFEPATKQMRLKALQPGVTVAQVREQTGFELLLADDMTELTPPTLEEIAIYRELRDGPGKVAVEAP